jgi:uncharacterized protein (TIGR03083 family)
MRPNCHTWTHARYCDAVDEEIAHMVNVVTGADPDTRVPTCPDWSIAELIKHLGAIHRWAGLLVHKQTPKRLSGRQIKLGLPRRKASYPRWLGEGAPPLVDALRQADPDAPMWAWGADQHVRFWSRRMLFETTVHRADAELALGREVGLDVKVAVDGIDELLDNLPGAVYFAPNVRELRGNGERLQLEATDTGDAWLIDLRSDGFTWGHDTSAAEASVRVRGLAADLYLLVWRRRPLDDARFDLAGNESVLARWLDKSAL